jgi:hypothetical protein
MIVQRSRKAKQDRHSKPQGTTFEHSEKGYSVHQKQKKKISKICDFVKMIVP